MRPTFGRLTRILATIMVIAGLGAVLAGFSSGGQTTPGSGSNAPILLLLGIGYLATGVGLWIEHVWAWWAGAGVTVFVVVMDLILGVHDWGLLLWSVFLAMFGVSAVQGWRGRTAGG